jgi:hypothetical protein
VWTALQNKNNDAICLNLETCIYKHFMVILPGERREFSYFDEWVPPATGMSSEVGIPTQG